MQEEARSSLTLFPPSLAPSLKLWVGRLHRTPEAAAQEAAYARPGRRMKSFRCARERLGE